MTSALGALIPYNRLVAVTAAVAVMANSGAAFAAAQYGSDPTSIPSSSPFSTWIASGAESMSSDLEVPAWPAFESYASVSSSSAVAQRTSHTAFNEVRKALSQLADSDEDEEAVDEGTLESAQALLAIFESSNVAAPKVFTHGDALALTWQDATESRYLTISDGKAYFRKYRADSDVACRAPSLNLDRAQDVQLLIGLIGACSDGSSISFGVPYGRPDGRAVGFWRASSSVRDFSEIERSDYRRILVRTAASGRPDQARGE